MNFGALLIKDKKGEGGEEYITRRYGDLCSSSLSLAPMETK